MLNATQLRKIQGGKSAIMEMVTDQKPESGFDFCLKWSLPLNALVCVIHYV